MRPWPPRRGSHVPTSHTHVTHTHISHTHTYTFHTHTRLFSHTTSQSLECPIPQVVVGDGGGFTKRERQAARLHRVSLQRDSVRHNSNCRSPRPRPGRDRRACARRAYGGVGPAPPVGGRPPFSVPSCICLFVFLAHPSLIRFPVGAFSLPPFYLPGAV
jgi:hypothetical protein